MHLTPPSDQTLAARHGALRALARRLCSDPDEAEDLVQETWLRTMLRRPARDGALERWQARVLRNLAWDRLRGLRPVTFLADDHGSVPGPEASFSDRERDDLLERLAALVADLPELYREVIERRYFRGETPPAIAASLGLPLETVRTRLRRARADCRRRLERTWPQGRERLALLLLDLTRVRDPRAFVAAKSIGGPALAALATCVLMVCAHVLSAFPAADPAVHARGSHWTQPGGAALSLATRPAGDARRAPIAGRSRRELPRAEQDTALPHAAPAATHGQLLEGRVVDELGHGLPGVDIWLSHPGRPESGVWRATSDRQGRFTLAGVDPAAWIAAGRRGVLLSDRLQLEGRFPAGGTLRPEITLGAHREVTMHVANAEGEPVAGAWIEAVRRRRHYPLVSLDGTVRLARHLQLSVLDEQDGAVLLPWSPATRASVRVGAPGYAPTVVRIAPGQTTVAVTLSAGHAVEGRVTLPSGEPAAAALVRTVQSRAVRAREVRSDERGRFRLSDLPAGVVALVVSATHAGGSFAAALEVDCARLELVERDVNLVPGGGVRGRATDEAGAPLVGWVVALGETARSVPLDSQVAWLSTHRFRVTETDARGRFAFAGVAGGRYSAWLLPPGADPAQPLVPLGVRHELEPGTGQVHLVRAPALAPSARARGLLTASDPADLRDASLLLTGEALHRAFTVDLDPATLALETELLPPGRYWLHLRRAGRPTQELFAFELAAGDELTLPPLTVRLDGVLALRASLGGRDLPSSVAFVVHSAGATEGVTAETERSVAHATATARVEGLPAGDYLVTANADGWSSRSRRVRIEPGVELAVDFELERGVRVPVHVDSGALAAHGQLAVCELRTLDGELVWTQGHYLDAWGDAAAGFFFRPIVAPGVYELLVTAERPDGTSYSARARARVGGRGGDKARVELVLARDR